jgi:hypothetical protein
VASLLLKYLGLPLGASYKSSTIWNDILEKTEHHLVGWKRLYLSKRVRLTLIKSTLFILSSYYVHFPYFCRSGYFSGIFV